jgi:hypothetical protein
MNKPDKPTSDLSQAAVALDQELRKFEELSELASRIKLSSEKNIERATDALSKAAESQDRISLHVRALVGAIAVARERQEKDSATLMARAHEIAARRTRYVELVQKMGALGGEAREVNVALQASDKTRESVLSVQEKLARIAEGAEELGKLAAAEELEDLSRQADSLRMQLQGARNKLNLLAEKLS